MPVEPTSVRDVVVVIPGIMGSELVDAQNGKLWSVSAGALTRAIRTLGASLRRLELPPGIGDDPADDGVRAVGLIKSLHVVPGLWCPVTGYERLTEFLRSDRFRLVTASPDDPGICPNLLSFPYDWRLSNRYNGRLLAATALEALERWKRQSGWRDAKLVLICHSMGGLVARWFAEQEGGAEHIRALITIGTPYRGALKSLTTLVNGLEPGIGPLHLSLSTFARSLPSMYQLLPQYDCVTTDSGRKPLLDADCPGLDPKKLADAVSFHGALASHGEPTYPLYKVVGIRQPTSTTARMGRERVETSFEIDGRNQGGDGTVPRLAAEPEFGRGREVHEVADQHGELQGSRSLLDLVDGILSREEIIWQGAPQEGVGVEMADVWSTRDEPRLRVTQRNDLRLLVALQDETGRALSPPVPLPPDGSASFGSLPEGGYRAVVSGRRRGGPTPVTASFVVLDPEGS